MQLVVPVDAHAVDRRLDAARRASPTYDGAGNGSRELTLRAPVGHGIAGFRTARDGLHAWAAHQITGLRVFPAGAPVQEGATYLFAFGTPFLAIAAPCRVTSVLDEPWHYAFAYDTLPGHPEVGRESFELRMEDDAVVFEVAATSRPSSPLAGLPPARSLQRAISKRYVEALARHVRLSAPIP